MLTVNIIDEALTFKDIKKENLKELLHIYNNTEEYMYATGIDRQMTFDDISQKYLEVLVNSHEFFVGIFEADTDFMIGAIKGRIDYDNMQEAWIMSLLIRKEYRGLGIGRRAVDNMIDCLYKKYDVMTCFTGVISGNSTGMSFWGKAGFNHIRTIDHYIKLNGEYRDYIIMKKEALKN